MALTAKKMSEAIRESSGFISKAASLCHVSRQTFYRNMEKYPSVKQELEDVREARHDFVENQLLKLIKDLNPTAIIFYLKTQCKQRGYVERQEVTGTDGSPLQFVQVEIGGIDVEKDI